MNEQDYQRLLAYLNALLDSIEKDKKELSNLIESLENANQKQ